MTDVPSSGAERAATALNRADPLVRGGALDALRFLAAAFFVLYHFDQHAPTPLADLHEGFSRGYLATDFFLMLSGYVLARTYGPRLETGRVAGSGFLLRRVARVWPAHALVLLGFAALVGGAQLVGFSLNNQDAFPWWQLPGHLLLAQAWGLGLTQVWNTPSWSLSALVVCYALFPVLWRGFSRLRPGAGLAVGAVAIVAADLTARAFGYNFYAFPQPMGVLRALPLFVLGLALARYGAPTSLTRPAAFALCLVSGAAAIGLQAFGRFDFLTIVAIAIMVLAAGARGTSRPSRLAAKGAEISFALYITHTLVGMVWYRGLELIVPIEELQGVAAWAVWSTGFAAAIAFAAAFHRLVDLPIKRRIDERLNRSGRSAMIREKLEARPGIEPGCTDLQSAA